MPTIKIKARKDSQFRQLVDYLHHDDIEQEGSFTYVHNIILDDPENTKGIVKAFMENDAHRRRRSNGVGQYHEMMSFHPEDSAYLKENPEVLEDFARIYLELRAPNALAVARPHFDKDHVHIHFMVSANEIGSKKSTRMSKAELAHLKKELGRLQEHYPELRNSYNHNRPLRSPSLSAATQSDAGVQMQKRGARPTLKEKLAGKVKNYLKEAGDIPTFKGPLEKDGLELYYRRGRPQGILHEGKKYRFVTLLGKGSPEVEKLSKLHEREKSRENGLELTREL